MIQRINEDEECLNNLLLSDEAHVHLQWLCEKHFIRVYSAQEYVTARHQHSLHSDKVTVLCAMSSYGMIGPYYLWTGMVLQLKSHRSLLRRALNCATTTDIFTNYSNSLFVLTRIPLAVRQ